MKRKPRFKKGDVVVDSYGNKYLIKKDASLKVSPPIYAIEALEIKKDTVISLFSCLSNSIEESDGYELCQDSMKQRMLKDETDDWLG